ncbi:MAG: CinA family protein [Butyrivibrio sp.]|jgi:PncC family amidohydrolase|nr:CinA family protein [Butyrivibrio sp.]MBQ7428812.1 CinA family protein [Butyrivibrio sp.]MCR4832230.1 CinA family protein [Butyrivibrio sp.]
MVVTECIELVETLKKEGMTITTAESCTGGLIAAAITDVPGSSEVFKRGFVTYCDEAKHEMLGVSEEVLATDTAVSERVASEMAEGAAKAAKADAAISVTGIAGPGGGSPDKPVGLVYIGIYVKGKKIVVKHVFEGTRAEVREQAVRSAIHSMRVLL